MADTTAAACAYCLGPPTFFVNGVYSCGQDVAATILQQATTNAVGHRWASVQVLAGAFVTPSRTDRQPSTSATHAKGGKGLEGPADA